MPFFNQAQRTKYKEQMINTISPHLEIQREPFAQPFAFKGSAFHEKWNMIVRLREANHEAVGIGGLAVLWSDAAVFESHTEVGGNLLQAAVLDYALQMVKDRAFADPMTMHQAIFPEVHEYAQQITRRIDLKPTFTRIALVALDNAAWLLHARQHGITTFDSMLPDPYRPYLSHRQTRIAITPAVGYNLSDEMLHHLLREDSAVLKIKIGHPGAEADMVATDMKRISAIHEIARGYETAVTDTGQVLYYLDANGRYGEKDSMARLLDHADHQGFLDRIILIEEPFQRPGDMDVHDLPARFAGDESVHTLEDVHVRMQQGYQAFAIKPAGKTLSLSLQMIEAATEAGAICFVADNACVPVLVEWNKNIAARLPPFPGIKGGILESNGPENYGSAWQRLLAEFPIPNAAWLRPDQGAFILDEPYYRESGGIFHASAVYSDLFRL
jgi:L-alanine-DL-glutamate epimerase-like enolase superfamily enzyme